MCLQDQGSKERLGQEQGGWKEAVNSLATRNGRRGIDSTCGRMLLVWTPVMYRRQVRMVVATIHPSSWVTSYTLIHSEN